MEIGQIGRIFIHFAMFGICFYALSSLDLAKVLLPGSKRAIKAQLLLLLLSCALGYLVAQFLIAIMYKL